MAKVIKQLSIGKYTVILLDSAPDKFFSAFEIDSVRYPVTPVYDTAGNWYGIEAAGDFAGKVVNFV